MSEPGKNLSPWAGFGRLRPFRGQFFRGPVQPGEVRGSAPAGGGDAGADAIAGSLADVGECDRRMRLPLMRGWGRRRGLLWTAGQVSQPAGQECAGLVDAVGPVQAAGGHVGVQCVNQCLAGPGIQASRCRWLASRAAQSWPTTWRHQHLGDHPSDPGRDRRPNPARNGHQRAGDDKRIQAPRPGSSSKTSTSASTGAWASRTLRSYAILTSSTPHTQDAAAYYGVPTVF